MQTDETKSNRRERLEVPLGDRLAYTPREVAALFGRAETWGYRRVYDGTFRPVLIGGRQLIPKEQVAALLAGGRAE